MTSQHFLKNDFSFHMVLSFLTGPQRRIVQSLSRTNRRLAFGFLHSITLENNHSVSDWDVFLDWFEHSAPLMTHLKKLSISYLPRDCHVRFFTACTTLPFPETLSILQVTLRIKTRAQHVFARFFERLRNLTMCTIDEANITRVDHFPGFPFLTSFKISGGHGRGVKNAQFFALLDAKKLKKLTISGHVKDVPILFQRMMEQKTRLSQLVFYEYPDADPEVCTYLSEHSQSLVDFEFLQEETDNSPSCIEKHLPLDRLEHLSLINITTEFLNTIRTTCRSLKHLAIFQPKTHFSARASAIFFQDNVFHSLKTLVFSVPKNETIAFKSLTTFIVDPTIQRLDDTDVDHVFRAFHTTRTIKTIELSACPFGHLCRSLRELVPPCLANLRISTISPLDAFEAIEFLSVVASVGTIRSVSFEARFLRFDLVAPILLSFAHLETFECEVLQIQVSETELGNSLDAFLQKCIFLRTCLKNLVSFKVRSLSFVYTNYTNIEEKRRVIKRVAPNIRHFEFGRIPFPLH